MACLSRAAEVRRTLPQKPLEVVGEAVHRESVPVSQLGMNEGVPADIAKFEGVRVVLIGPGTIQRGWNAQRVFPGMVGKLGGPAVLPSDEVRRMLSAMEKAAKEES